MQGSSLNFKYLSCASSSLKCFKKPWSPQLEHFLPYFPWEECAWIIPWNNGVQWGRGGLDNSVRLSYPQFYTAFIFPTSISEAAKFSVNTFSYEVVIMHRKTDSNVISSLFHVLCQTWHYFVTTDLMSICFLLSFHCSWQKYRLTRVKLPALFHQKNQRWLTVQVDLWLYVTSDQLPPQKQLGSRWQLLCCCVILAVGFGSWLVVFTL